MRTQLYSTTPTQQSHHCLQITMNQLNAARELIQMTHRGTHPTFITPEIADYPVRRTTWKKVTMRKLAIHGHTWTLLLSWHEQTISRKHEKCSSRKILHTDNSSWRGEGGRIKILRNQVADVWNLNDYTSKVYIVLLPNSSNRSGLFQVIHSLESGSTWHVARLSPAWDLFTPQTF